MMPGRVMALERAKLLPVGFMRSAIAGPTPITVPKGKDNPAVPSPARCQFVDGHDGNTTVARGARMDRGERESRATANSPPKTPGKGAKVSLATLG